MNSQEQPLFLPILRKENMAAINPNLAKILSKCNASYIWPGLEHMPNDYWQPNNFAFNSKESKAIIDEFYSMSEAALSGVPVHALINANNQNIELQNIQEKQSLSYFASTGEQNNDVRAQSSDNIYILKSAQSILLWAWLLEERFAEINSLTTSYENGTKSLAQSLGIEEDDELLNINQVQSTLSNNENFLPPWQLVLENVIHFLPNKCSIVVNNHEMSLEVADICDQLSPLSEDTKNLLQLQHTNIKAKECHISLGDLLRKSLRQQQSNDIYAKVLHFIILEENNEQ